ncbi:hypothetical protein ITR00_07270 [Pediococcus pentosaceus]|uniref:hypothetical protein n=1 Tax=Pediococcus pentosaceus TaxID=1255 RepID=UPI00190C6362|nr:hypothetical protein [Pediococcus pentosaceus]MBF7125834.1 hypothetical protein [Pediococcus pentosaceus]WPK15839.1 hypothetical protein R6U75_05225 [Pediococcus pentosaceus]
MNKNIENDFTKIVGKMYDKALKEAQERDSCRYCHEPFECLGAVADHDTVFAIKLNELFANGDKLIKFCPVCGRDLSIESYVDRMYQARKESGEAMKKIDGLLKAKK